MNSILQCALSKDNYRKFGNIIKKVLRSEEAKGVYSVVQILHEETEQDLCVEDVVLGLARCYPEKKAQTLSRFVEQWGPFNNDLVLTYLRAEGERASAYDLALQALAVYEGKEPYSGLVLPEPQNPGSGFQFVSQSIHDLQEQKQSKGAFKWRLKALNSLLGHVPAQTLGVVFARPDVGKTTFLASEISYFLLQTEKPILWIANEETPETVAVRIRMAAFGVTEAELFSGKEEFQARWSSKIADRLLLSGDPELNTRGGIESAIRQFGVSLLVVDQASKVLGFDDERYDLQIGKCFQWLRHLSNKYGIPVIAVTQAGSSAEGKKYLDFNDMANSHTSIAAEADWILGIGKGRDNEASRYLHTCKDKLPLSAGKDPTRRHGYAEVLLDADRARFNDCHGA